MNRPPANLHTPTRSLLDDLEFPATKLLRFIRRVYLASIEKEKEGNSLPVSFNEKARGEEATSSSFLSLSLLYQILIYIYIYYILIFQAKYALANFFEVKLFRERDQSLANLIYFHVIFRKM